MLKGRLQEMHDQCIQRANEIGEGPPRRMPASHYLDQAIGISHALDLLTGSEIQSLTKQLRDYIAGEPLSDPVAVDLCKQMLALLGEKL